MFTIRFFSNPLFGNERKREKKRDKKRFNREKHKKTKKLQKRGLTTAIDRAIIPSLSKKSPANSEGNNQNGGKRNVYFYGKGRNHFP